MQNLQEKSKGQLRFPQPTSHTSLEAAQQRGSVLGCEQALPGHVQLFIHQNLPSASPQSCSQ